MYLFDNLKYKEISINRLTQKPCGLILSIRFIVCYRSDLQSSITINTFIKDLSNGLTDFNKHNKN